MLYWRIHKSKPFWSKEKLLSGTVAVVIVLTSVLGLVSFVLDKKSR
jgi:hypothetical protein